MHALRCSPQQNANSLGGLPGTDTKMKTFAGRVRPGTGFATERFARAFTEIQKRTGMTLVPGTLNVKVLREYALHPDDVIPAHLGNGGEDLQYAACKIVARRSLITHPALIVRTSTQAQRRSIHALSIFEIAAGVRLRDALQVGDGDAVDLALDNHATLRRC